MALTPKVIPGKGGARLSTSARAVPARQPVTSTTSSLDQFLGPECVIHHDLDILQLDTRNRT